MGRTVPTSNQENSMLIADMRKIREGLTTRDKKYWDEFMTTGHLNERAISLAVFPDPYQSFILALLFKQFKMIKALGGTVKESAQESLELSDSSNASDTHADGTHNT